METQVRIVGMLYLVWNGLTLMALAGAGAALALLSAGAVELSGADIPAEGLAATTGTALGLPLLLGCAGLVLALPGFLAGWGLLHFRQWARILALILAALYLLEFPIGTALGIYSFMVLLTSDTERLFTGASPH